MVTCTYQIEYSISQATDLKTEERAGEVNVVRTKHSLKEKVIQELLESGICALVKTADMELK